MEKNSLETGIARDTVKETEQKLMRDELYTYQDLDVDAKAANNIYRFLTAKTNEVLSFDSLYNIYQKRHQGVVSIACGLVLDENYEITYDEPITPSTQRVVRITNDEYKAFYTSATKGIKIIDLDKKPIFDKARVEVLQRYMKFAKDYTINLESSKTK